MYEQEALDLKEQIDQLTAQIRTWRWAPDNPIATKLNRAPALLERLRNDYREGLPEDRAEIRRITQPVASLLLGTISVDLQELQATGDAKWLEYALLDFSMFDLEEDPRDMLELLGRIYVTAAGAGIDPESYIAAVAAVSSTDEKDQWGTTTQSFLASLKETAYFRASVEPELKRLGGR